MSILDSQNATQLPFGSRVFVPLIVEVILLHLAENDLSKKTWLFGVIPKLMFATIDGVTC